MATESAIRQYAAALERGLAEELVFTPYGGAARTVTALVDRQPPAFNLEAPSPRLRIRLLNHATLGVLASALDTLRDQITVAYKAGGTAVAMTTGNMVYSDADEVVMEIV